MAQLWSPHIGELNISGLKGDSISHPNGTIDGMPIGGATPAAGAFTSVSINGSNVLPDTGGSLAGGLTGAKAAIVSAITDATTADSSHVFFILPTGVAGDQRLVYNSGGASAQTITIACQTGDTIDGGSSGGSVTLTVVHRAAWFYCVAANTWISALVGAVST